MRLLKKLTILLCFSLLICACAPTQEPFEEIEISAEQLQTKLDDQDDFVIIIERDNCSHCKALNAYIEETSGEHAGIVLYQLDITDFDLVKEKEEDTTLIAQDEDGQVLLDMAPYFLYTPTLYKVEDGKAVSAAIGYNEATNEVCLWDVDSTVDFNSAETEDFWAFVENGQGA